jgi:hypothetical protein
LSHYPLPVVVDLKFGALDFASMTPAMAAGVVSSPWEMSDNVKLMEASNAEREKRDRAEGNERSYNPFGDALGHGPK